jgi:hypothetical protein
MTILFSVLGTFVFVALWPVLANIYSVTPFDYIAVRWAIALWTLTLDAILFYLAFHFAGYV